MGLEDPSLSLQSAVPSLGQGSSRQEFEQWSHQSEHKNSDQRVQDYVQEDQHRASHQDTLDAISGHSSKPWEVSHHRLGFVRELMRRDGYQPVQVFLCGRSKVFDKLNVI